MLSSLAFTCRGSCRYFSTSRLLRTKRSHYDVLGVTPKATQKDIKGAYFRLCMVHHPDQRENKSTSDKFLEIQEAYDVLGNVTSRKLYDKGVNPIRMPRRNTDSYDFDPSSKFYKAKQRVTRPQTSASTPIYNFDEWTKQHYAATFKRDMERKKKTAFNEELEKKTEAEMKTNQFLGVVAVFIFTLMYMSYRVENHDIVMEENRSKELAFRHFGG